MPPPNTTLRRFFAAYAEELGRALAKATALSIGTLFVLLLSELAR